MPGTWKSLTNQPTFNTSTMILLTDGRVMVQEEGTAHWHALTPDADGSYINGTWSSLQDMSFWRRYYALGVLKDGRVFICGGEQSGDTGDSKKGEIYDPVLDKWTPIALPPWTQVGDAASTVLPNGKVMIGALQTGDCIIYDPSADSWSATGSQSGRTNEETWVLLPDDTIVTTQCFSPYHGLKYVISTGAWQDEGVLPATIADSVQSEVGPGMLLYNGKVIFFGAANSSGHGKTVLYTKAAMPNGTGAYVAGPDIPKVGGQVIVCNDCPAALMPNGKVLFSAANFVNGGWGTPVLFFEYDPSTNTIAQAPTPPNNATYPYSGPTIPGVYWSRMMLLPTGDVMFSASSSNVQVYHPDGGPQDGWRPTVTSVNPHGAINPDYYLLQGTQLNGLSQANMYGDDCCPATNYPLVQLTNTATHDIYYCRTYDFSTMGVATGASAQSCRFKVGSAPPGNYDLRVIANGIASHAFSFQIPKFKLREVPLKLVYEYVGKLVAEGDPFTLQEQIIDPEITELRTRLGNLQSGIDRLNSIIQASGLPAVGAGTAKAAGKNQLTKDEGEEDEKDDKDGDKRKGRDDKKKK
jgi:hypothetical protein